VKQIFTLDDQLSWHPSVAPMRISDPEKGDNPDIADYRG
jgi:hypothetical protein